MFHSSVKENDMTCLECGHTWEGDADENECPACGSLNVSDSVSDAFEQSEDDEDEDD